MDLVDLNHYSHLKFLDSFVEILMDLVDLNCNYFFNLISVNSRDPYGSRGSKSDKTLVSVAMFCRDPYGSRGSKY